MTNALEGTEDDIVWENGNADTISESNCGNGSDKSFSKHDIDVRSNTWDAQLAIPNEPRYARLETNLGIGQAKKGSNSAETVL
ncbi:hypothetical protein TNCV_3721151 [Trichonephila clavipes]|nr:hypothetical protein TNCV_3721151 [Trichonephila clavipes]